VIFRTPKEKPPRSFDIRGLIHTWRRRNQVQFRGGTKRLEVMSITQSHCCLMAPLGGIHFPPMINRFVDLRYLGGFIIRKDQN